MRPQPHHSLLPIPEVEDKQTKPNIRTLHSGCLFVDRGVPRPCPGPNKNVEATQPDTISDVLSWKSGATVIWLESTANPQPQQKENTIEEVKNEQCT
jgi:hypothetical protein